MIHGRYPVPSFLSKHAYINETKYQEYYQHSLKSPEEFWGQRAAEYLSWFKKWKTVLTGGFEEVNVRWFEEGKLNASYNCLDRHLQTKASKPALIWESDNPNLTQTLSYQDLFERVCCFANVLKRHGIKKGDRVCIYLPMIPEAAIAMLACTRIGAIHSVVFAGFSAESLSKRIKDADCQLVITANVGLRGSKVIPLKTYVDAALVDCPHIRKVIVVRRTDDEIPWDAARNVWYHNEMAQAQNTCYPEQMDANDSLFILYTSGSTGKPKGILHGTAGYLLYVALTFKLIFDYRSEEIFWCTADIGWITGHSYGLYGPLLNGATTLFFEGVPYFPSFARYWEVIDKHKVNIFYTAPTALRALRKEGDEWVKKTSRKSLRILGSVGEPINPEVWEWYYKVVGERRCSVVDTWWQTETGGIMISPLPGATPLKPGSACWPFFGIQPEIVDEKGTVLPENRMGKLVITKPWPGLMQTVFNDHSRFVTAYFTTFPGAYLTGDQAYKDKEGYFWILGRDDDVIKVSGHRIGTAEIESALLGHASVSEVAVVPVEDAIKGHGIYAFVTLKVGIKPSAQLKTELNQMLRQGIGPIAQLDAVQWAEGLPKTRSGKIMRRLLRKIANEETSELGDLTTLADPTVVEQLIDGREKN